MNESHDGQSTIAELMAQEDSKTGRQLVQLIAGALIALGLLFTGFLNFMLYSRPFPADYKIAGLIPALLIEGSLATFMLGSFVWFAHGMQGRLAKLFGWAMFIIVAANTVVEFNLLAGNGAGNEMLALYAFWGVPIVIPLVVGFWKAVIDTDPDIMIMRQQRKLTQALRIGKVNAVFKHLASEQSRQALGSYGARVGGQIDQQLIGDGTSATIEPPAHKAQSIPERIKAAVNGNKPDDHPNG